MRESGLFQHEEILQHNEASLMISAAAGRAERFPAEHFVIFSMVLAVLAASFTRYTHKHT